MKKLVLPFIFFIFSSNYIYGGIYEMMIDQQNTMAKERERLDALIKEQREQWKQQEQQRAFDEVRNDVNALYEENRDLKKMLQELKNENTNLKNILKVLERKLTQEKNDNDNDSESSSHYSYLDMIIEENSMEEKPNRPRYTETDINECKCK